MRVEENLASHQVTARRLERDAPALPAMHRVRVEQLSIETDRIDGVGTDWVVVRSNRQPGVTASFATVTAPAAILGCPDREDRSWRS